MNLTDHFNSPSPEMGGYFYSEVGLKVTFLNNTAEPQTSNAQIREPPVSCGEMDRRDRIERSG